MKKYIILLLAVFMALPMSAQRRRSTTGHRQTTTTKKAKAMTSKKSTYTPTKEIRGQQSELKKVEEEIRSQQNRLYANKADVEQRLQNLLVINSEITSKQKDIEGYENDIKSLDNNIDILNSQMSTLQEQLKERQQKYIKSLREMAKHRSIQDKLMFIFSAKNLKQAYRRLRFIQEYASFQRSQGEQIKGKQEEINQKNLQLKAVKGQKNDLLNKGKIAEAELREKHTEQEKVVDDLKNEQQTIQVIISEQEKKREQINAEIDRLVAVEVEKARLRAEAEAKRKAEAEAAKQRAEAEAKRRAEAEKARQEEQRRIAAAKAEEARLKAEAEKAAREHARLMAEEKAAAEARAKAKREAEEKARQEAAAKERREAEARARKAEAEARAAEEKARHAAEEQQRAQQAAREAESARVAAEQKAAAENQRREKEAQEAAREAEKAERMSAVDRQISGSFESNKGRLPMPVTGSYKIINRFGQREVDGLNGVRLDNKGIDLLCQPGATVRAIYDGDVSAVVSVSGQTVVMVRHGDFISVYCNLRNVHVRSGQKVTTRQALGTVGDDNVLQFQLRRETSKLNPEDWLAR